ncbi:hypothetical protein FCV25MIE_14487 [Fagus crenata]
MQVENESVFENPNVTKIATLKSCLLKPHQESSSEKQESSVSENPSNSEIEYAISRSSEKGEAPELKAKKSVKMLGSENESVFENPNVTKIATLKPCPLKPRQESSPEKQESSVSENPSNSEIEYAISRSSEKGEAPEPKAKKSVKMQRSENESVFENPNVTKIATLKSCPLKPHQESSSEKQESQAESPAGAKELLVNEARLVESFLELPPMFSSVSENPSNSEIEYAISRSSEKGEAPEPKAKKSVKMRSENESVFENPNVTKIATLKPCPLKPHQESSPEKQESQAESPAGAKELLVNEARLVESFLELPPMFSSVSENPSNSEIEYAISRSSEKGEAPEPKAKKSVKMQRSENESVFENPNVTKIATAVSEASSRKFTENKNRSRVTRSFCE